MLPVNKLNFDAVITDLDGVVTATTNLHIKAWKQSLDSFLQNYSEKYHSKYDPMNVQYDYKQFIDGKPRYIGVNSFIKSRKISLPYGSPSDRPGFNTICALGNYKNELYLALINTEGAKVYRDAIESIIQWRSFHLKIAVVSSSKNCRKVLSSSGIVHLFDLIIDGNDSEQNDIPGKPEPDIFLFACKCLKSTSDRTVILEDSISGVQAGKKGKFAMIIGVSRNGSSDLLYQYGADYVVSVLTDIPV